MTLSELLFLMADVNRRDLLANIAEGWFPDDGPPDFVFGQNSVFHFGARGRSEVKATVVHLAADYRDRTAPPPKLLVQDGRTANIASGADIQNMLLASGNDDQTGGDLKEQYFAPQKSLSFFIKNVDGRNAQRPTSSYFTCLADGEDYPLPGIVQHHDNYETVDSDRGAFVARFVDTCAALQVFYSVSGFGPLTTSYNSYKSVRNFPIFKRFPGLMYWNNGLTVPEGDRSDDWILDVNWLTGINEAMLDRVGGYKAARSILPAEVLIHRFDGGVVFQAGEKPRLGDHNVGDLPTAYRAVNRLLVPLRYPDWQSLRYVRAPEPVGAQQATSAWISRFDE
ncbi:type VI immunity family protein [Fulvimarina sp. MAC8]|uniref:type VI immunity family protein n=1 Tax=Fulvimarina sp. MAC8 TaxID=3162874 RepID=UPI0032EB8DE3